MSEDGSGTLLDRTLRNVAQAWRDIAASAVSAVGGSPEPDPDLPDAAAKRIEAQMRACLEARGGDVSARARAATLGQTYLVLNPVGRRRFLHILARDFDVDPEAVAAAVATFREATDEAARRRAEAALRRALEPPRMRLLTQFNDLPQGVKFLVDLRADLMPFARRDPDLARLEADLKALLASWFDVGFLKLRRITWDSPALLLEKLIAYEAVHEIRSWNELKDRLDSDRRCFAFFHPSMPREPLIFVEVALVNGLADNIQGLLDRTGPAKSARAADTAIFYSISNAQRGLAGISFGGFLIKRVVDQLAGEVKGLKTFATLSPAPGFCAWIGERLAEADARDLLTPGEWRALAELPEPIVDPDGFAAALSRGHWSQHADAAKALRGPLLRLFGRYLLTAKRPDGKALDPVAHFHLSNGARVERVNWLADISSNGLKQSAGIMVNYLYRLEEIERNHEAYTDDGTIAAAAAARTLARK